MAGGLCAASILAAASSAHACRELDASADRLAGYETVLLAKVQTARRADSGGPYAWEVVFDGKTRVAGSPVIGRYTAIVVLYLGGCGEPQLPGPGDPWALYFNSTDAGSVAWALPLSLAKEGDARIDPLSGPPAADELAALEEYRLRPQQGVGALRSKSTAIETRSVSCAAADAGVFDCTYDVRRRSASRRPAGPWIARRETVSWAGAEWVLGKP